MVKIEQVELLESRIAKAVDYVEHLSAENKALAAEKEKLQTKLEANQKRIDELEVLVMRFKEDQGRIEDGIQSALNRLSQFEDAFEKTLGEKPVKKTAQKSAPKAPASREVCFEITEPSPVKDAPDDEDTSTEAELDIF
jgi:predicted nuclease with TOPRIM domain